MCLYSVDGTPKKTTGLGWKVFRLNEDGKLTPGNRGRNPYEYGLWYNARAYWNKWVGDFTEKLGSEGYPRTYYPNGFHIALRREDAREFVTRNKKVESTEKYVIRQVEYRGAHTQGSGNTSYFGGPQVIANEIRILPPRKGGSAYAKEKKAGKQPVIENGVAL